MTRNHLVRTDTGDAVGTVAHRLAHTDVAIRVRWTDGRTRVLSWHRLIYSTDAGRTLVVCPVALSPAQLHRAIA